MKKMEIVYDPETDSMDIEFQKGKYEVSKEITEGIIIDYTKDGKIISIGCNSLRSSLVSLEDLGV